MTWKCLLSIYRLLLIWPERIPILCSEISAFLPGVLFVLVALLLPAVPSWAQLGYHFGPQ